MTRVLIAVDSSETSIAAARAAHRLFGDFADYVVLNVASQPMIWGGDAFAYGMVYPVAIAGTGDYPFSMVTSGGTASSIVADAEHTAEDIATAAGLSDATAIGDTGDAAHAIVAAATQHRADVIVIGTHDRNWFMRLLMPSVASSVLRESSNIPVLVAR